MCVLNIFEINCSPVLKNDYFTDPRSILNSFNLVKTLEYILELLWKVCETIAIR